MISKASIGYTHLISEEADVFAYFGFPGEPALGPPAFMHRISAFSNPDASLGHHWQDATHIVFGVATMGFRYCNFKAEGSTITGREPIQNRLGFDRPTFDSYSYRFTFNPSDKFSLQFSQGQIKSPEILEPEEDVKRTTASLLFSNPLGTYRALTASFVWGLNQGAGDHVEHSVLGESNLQLDKTSLYSRYEFIQKSRQELGLPETGVHDNIHNVHALTLGVSQVVARRLHTNLALGLQGTVYKPEDILAPVYGHTPVSAQVYLRLTPGLMRLVGGGSHQH